MLYIAVKALKLAKRKNSDVYQNHNGTRCRGPLPFRASERCVIEVSSTISYWGRCLEESDADLEYNSSAGRDDQSWQPI